MEVRKPANREAAGTQQPLLLAQEQCWWVGTGWVGVGERQEPGMLMNHAGVTGDKGEVGTKHTIQNQPPTPWLQPKQAVRFQQRGSCMHPGGG